MEHRVVKETLDDFFVQVKRYKAVCNGCSFNIYFTSVSPMEPYSSHVSLLDSGQTVGSINLETVASICVTCRG